MVSTIVELLGLVGLAVCLYFLGGFALVGVMVSMLVVFVGWALGGDE